MYSEETGFERLFGLRLGRGVGGEKEDRLHLVGVDLLFHTPLVFRVAVPIHSATINQIISISTYRRTTKKKYDVSRTEY